MLEVFGKASVPVEPAEGALHDPAFWKDDELDAVWAFDDFENVAEHGFGPFDDTLLVARIDNDFKQVRQENEQPDQDKMTASGVGDAARRGGDRQQVALGVYRDVPFAALDLLAAVITALPPFCTVFTLWLSMMATVGSGFLPAFTRTLRRRSWLISSHMPAFRIRQNVT